MMNTLLAVNIVLLVVLVLVTYRLYVLIKSVDEFSHQLAKNVFRLENSVRDLEQEFLRFEDDLK